MAKDKKVEQITDMEQDFAQWFTDVCTKAELVDYSGIKGLFILRPYGYAIWENIQKELDRMFKEGGHENVSMPMLIPESLLQKEKDHVVSIGLPFLNLPAASFLLRPRTTQRMGLNAMLPSLSVD